MRRSQQQRGFTLIELLVVIAIIGVLSSVVLASMNTARAKARDAKRKEDLVQLRTALQLYYIDHNGVYPLASPGAWGGVSTVPCGAANSTAYISGMTPTYIAILPVDPGPVSTCNGYLYNSNGTHYKLLVHASAESYPAAGQSFYDPVRPTWAWMITDKEDSKPGGCTGDVSDWPICW